MTRIAGGGPGAGFVSLVGAGPGDPELLTVRAARRLAEAEVILHDALVPPAVLQLGSGHRVDVGKRAGTESTTQEEINALLVRTARRGRRVVRLKCGDPFVLGRGGEEALALVEAGVPFEVVPGVSSAIAAPALAGIPVTHRGKASAFVVVSGHAEATWRPVVQGLEPNSLTVVVLMGLASRALLARTLLARGWSPRTPAAVLLGAATAEASSWFGELAGLGSARLDGRSSAPGTICIGAVVSLARVIGEPARAADPPPRVLHHGLR